MKVVTSMMGVFCALALLAGPIALRADDDDKKPCCPATVEGGKACAHECCVKASKDGKVCEKCHPKKEDKK
jgi:hypothetical protein